MKKIIGVASLALGISFLVACSIEKKNADSPNRQRQTRTENASYPKAVPPVKEVTIIKPKPRPEKKPLSRRAMFADTLGAHNRVRAKHHLPPLKWSNQLASISQQWADQLGKGRRCKMYHHKGSVPFGENLFRASAIMWSDGRRDLDQITITRVVKAWTDEEKWYDYARNRCQPGKQCGHYTQAVWKGTKEVGCAMKVCADKSQTWVCSYFPAGNFVGARPY